MASPDCASHADSHGLCFEHVGLQGKPMPEFCIVSGARSGDHAASPPRPVLIVSDSTFDEVLRRCGTDRLDAVPPQAGVYRWTRKDGESASGVVGPQTMKWIADKVRLDALRRDEAVPEVMLQLSRRLGT
jgi:hypothetical protein